MLHMFLCSNLSWRWLCVAVLWPLHRTGLSTQHRREVTMSFSNRLLGDHDNGAFTPCSSPGSMPVFSPSLCSSFPDRYRCLQLRHGV